MMLDDGCKINNLNTTFLRGTVASQTNQTFFTTPKSIAKDHYQLITQGHHSIQKSKQKPKSLKVTIRFYELII